MTRDDPLIIGFDTSQAACRVALIRGKDVLAQSSEEMSKGQAERLLPLCEEVLLGAGFTPKDLAAVGVGIGPGNFTGIRISVSAARGLALGLAIPAIGVSAFEALQYGQTDACACALDARRDHVYIQHFDAAGSATAPVLASATTLPTVTGPVIGYQGADPLHPTAVAICHLTAMRYKAPHPRPAPLYLRPADAAPARDAPPTILT